MSHAKSDEDIIKSKFNISRFFVEQRHIAWVMLIAVCVWGFYSYRSMPQRKDPDTPVKSAVVLTSWPGAKAEKIEQLVTRKVEEKIAQNARVDKIRSISRTNLSVVYVDLDENMPGRRLLARKSMTSRSNSAPSWIAGRSRPRQFHQGLRDTAALCSLSPARSQRDRDQSACAGSQ
jgi:multidrug efflux pump subunit AcrB